MTAFLNGLGSKGVLRAPWVARQLTEHLLDGKPIEPELDLAGNLWGLSGSSRLPGAFRPACAR